MKPKQPLTEWNIRIVVRNPFTATMVTTIGFSDVAPDYIKDRLVELYDSVALSPAQMADWGFWGKYVDHKKARGWGARRIYNFISHHFDMFEAEQIELKKVIGTRFGKSAYLFEKGQLKLNTTGARGRQAMAKVSARKPSSGLSVTNAPMLDSTDRVAANASPAISGAQEETQ